jgi:hypothetical protein
MLPEAKNEDLAYIAADGASCVFSYRSGKALGTIKVGAQGACSDANGNVYLAAYKAVYQLAHGGTAPMPVENPKDTSVAIRRTDS